MPTAPPLAVPYPLPAALPQATVSGPVQRPATHAAVLDALLARQAGVITRAQALAAGLSPDAVDRRLRSRRWRPLHPRVYLAAGHPHGDEARVRAALHWAGDGALLAGSAAAWWHGIAVAAPAAVDVTVPRARRPRARPGVRVRRRDVAPADRAAVRGIPVAAAPLAVLEAAVECGAPFLDRALQEHVAFPAVLAAHRRLLGAHGSAAAGRLLEAAADRAGASARALLAGLLHRSGLPGWHAGPPGDGATAVLPLARVVVAVQGWAWRPGPPPEGGADRAGWTVLRCEWRRLAQHPDAVLAALRAAVERVR
ncbi:MAG: hypothetical protein AB7J32_18215 [Pseudonocardia sp.]